MPLKPLNSTQQSTPSPIGPRRTVALRRLTKLLIAHAEKVAQLRPQLRRPN